MLKLFGTTDTDFSSNGDLVLKPLLAVIHKEDNADYYLELETGIEYVDDLIEGRIIVANTPQGDQPFRINNVNKTVSKIKITCPHVYYDSKNYLVEPIEIKNKRCTDALEIVNASSTPESPFKTLSDVQTINSISIEYESLYDAFSAILDTYGGHLIRDGFKVIIQAEIGKDNGVLIQYKKNLKDITCAEVWDNVVTKLLPIGQDGIMLNTLNANASQFVVSKKQYEIPYVKTITFDQDIQRDDYASELAYQTALIADLKAQAQAYVDSHCLPQVNYTLSAHVDEITDIGDIIAVRDSRLGVDLVTSVIAFEYDAIWNRFTKLEFGNFGQTIRGLGKEIKKKSTVQFIQHVDHGTLLAEIRINGRKHFIYAPI